MKFGKWKMICSNTTTTVMKPTLFRLVSFPDQFEKPEPGNETTLRLTVYWSELYAIWEEDGLSGRHGSEDLLPSHSTEEPYKTIVHSQP